MPLARATRWVLGGAAAVVAVGTSFTLGVVAGAGSADPGGGVLDEAADRIADEALAPVDRAALDAAAVSAMLRAAGDTWGVYTGDEVATPGAYVGVGLWLRPDGPAVAVAQVAPGSPADAAGVLVGDEVRAVSGRSTELTEVALVAASLRGLAGSTVEVVLARDGDLRTVTLTRAEVPAPRVGLEVLPHAPDTLPVVLVTVPVFEPGVGRQVRERLAEVPDAAGIVLDLRGNGGGLLTEAVETASVFLDGGTVVRWTGRDQVERELQALGDGDTATPLVVLVDGGSASAAEVVAGALQDRGRALLVGSRSFGKGSVQEPMALSDGSQLQLTVAAYTTPSGRSLEGVGLEPDIAVAPGSAPELVVERAVEVLTGLVAVGAGSSG